MDTLFFAVWNYMIGCCIALVLINWINKQPQEADVAVQLPTDLSYFSWLLVLFCIGMVIRQIFKR